MFTHTHFITTLLLLSLVTFSVGQGIVRKESYVAFENAISATIASEEVLNHAGVNLIKAASGPVIAAAGPVIRLYNEEITQTAAVTQITINIVSGLSAPVFCGTITSALLNPWLFPVCTFSVGTLTRISTTSLINETTSLLAPP